MQKNTDRARWKGVGRPSMVKLCSLKAGEYERGTKTRNGSKFELIRTNNLLIRKMTIPTKNKKHADKCGQLIIKES